jgi:hypothetical protein
MNQFIKKRIKSLTLIIILIIFISSFLAGCDMNEDLAGEAREVKEITTNNKLLVLELNEKSNIEKVYLQDYNKKQFDFFKNLKIEEFDNFDNEIIIRSKNVVLKEFYSNEEIWIYEDFKIDGIISLEGYKVRKGRPTIKIPLGQELDINKPFEIISRNLKTGKEKVLSTNKNFNKLKQTLEPKDNKITGRVVNSFEGICDNLIEVVPGHNDQNSLDRTNIIFVNFGNYNEDAFIESLTYYLDLNKEGIVGYKINNIGELVNYLSHGLFYYVPFDENHNKFNFWYINENFAPYQIITDGNSCNCAPPDFNELISSECSLNNKKIISLCHTYCQSHAELDGLNAEVSTLPLQETDPDYFPGSVAVFVHEFGHLFGDLKDEYTKINGIDFPGYPNCAPSEELGNNWWQEILPDIELFKGCSYNEDNFKFSESSKMGGGGSSFGDVNQLYLCYKIFQASGEVGGDYCLNILNGYQPTIEICDDNIDNDGNGKIDCQDPNCWGQSCQEDCSVKNDEDQDGWIDCFDEDCAGESCGLGCQCSSLLTAINGKAVGIKKEIFCDDGINNDEDKEIDCFDSDCELDPNCIITN